ncbi:transposase [Bdellovibrio sp. HCB-110]
MGRKSFICHTEFPYHITARCINREWFATDMNLVWKTMTRQLHFIHLAYGVRIHAFVLMSNHFHLIARAPEGNLSEAMQFFMSETGKDLRDWSDRINRTYGSRFHRSLISSPLYYLHAYKYVYRNPIEAGICKSVEDYEFSSLKGLLGEGPIEVPIFDDGNWENWESRTQTLNWLNTQPDRGSWEQVQKALKKEVFKLARQNNRPSVLENDAL